MPDPILHTRGQEIGKTCTKACKILLRKDKRHRLMLGVRLIQQAAAVEIDVNDVAPIYVAVLLREYEWPRKH